MLKQLVNDAEFVVRMHSETPLLIKSGTDPMADVDMSPVRTRGDLGDQTYIPGSSAKGVLRSHGERIARTLAGDHPERGSCNPFQKSGQEQSCSERLKAAKDGRGRMLSGDEVYAGACPICRLFGCLSLQSRITFPDFYPITPQDRATIEKRDGVGIDRFTGGSSNGALFKIEVAVGGSYTGTIRIRNFELWQMGLVAFILRDLMEGELTFGLGASRGLGQIKAEVLSARLRSFLPNAPADRIFGLAAQQSLGKNYKFSDDTREREGISSVVAGMPGESGIGLDFPHENQEDVTALLKSVAPIWPAFMAQRVAEAS